MDRVKVTTAQNVHINYEAAGIGDRAIATIFDMMLLSAYFILVLFFWGDHLEGALLVVTALPYLFYFLLSEIFLDGQTIGKRARGIKVARIDGTPPRLGDYIIRWLFRLIEIDATGGMLAVVTLFIRGNGQRLGDMAAGTAVVKIAKTITLKDTLYADVDADYVPIHPEAVHLSEQDITLAKEVHDMLIREKSTLNTKKIGTKMKETLEQKMEVTSSLPPLAFLRAVIKDFNHMNK